MYLNHLQREDAAGKIPGAEQALPDIGAVPGGVEAPLAREIRKSCS
jgi:hypothetical protein